MPTLKATARHLDLSPERVRQLVALQVFPDPRKSDLDAIRITYLRHLREVAAGRAAADGTIDLTTERALLARAQKESAELRNATTRRELIPAHEIGSLVSMMIVALKSALQALPSRIRQQAPHLDAHDVKALQDGIDAALHEFADALTSLVPGERENVANSAQ